MAITFFEFQIKGGILLAISVLIYILFLSNDNFLNRNRAYLISNLFLPWIIPLIAMPLWVKDLLFGTPDIANIPVTPLVVNNAAHIPVPIPAESSFSWEMAGLFLYGFISFVLLIKLLWAYNYTIRLKKRSELKRFKGFQLAILPDKQTGPFSFFRTIFLPKSLEKNIDKDLVLEHEKTHIAQWHSIDISLAELLLVFHWWNPFAWWLRKLIALNHDYSVDKIMLKQASEPKRYQYSLINILSGNNQIQLVNHFNKNLTKKRIIMMNKENSNRYTSWLKGIIIVPLITLFFLGFTNSDKINNNPPKEAPVYTTSNVGKIKLKDNIVATQESKLTNTKSKVNKKEEQVKPTLTKVHTETKVQKKVKGKVSSKETQNPIKDVKIYNKYGELQATSNEKGEFSFSFVGNQKIPKEHQGEILFVKKGFQPRHYKLDLMASTKKVNIELETEIKTTSEKLENKYEVKGFLNTLLNNNNIDKYRQPLYIIDGKVSTINTINSLNPNSIESISVLKGKTATALYGNKGKNDVISVSLKKNPIDNSKKIIISSFSNDDVKDVPLIIINGKESTKAELKKLDPESVESMEVIKDKTGIEKYGIKAKNGVVIVKLKETDNK
ncbi:MAG: M56 family metallopeptidase [Bacteroidota bacterium]